MPSNNIQLKRAVYWSICIAVIVLVGWYSYTKVHTASTPLSSENPSGFPQDQSYTDPLSDYASSSDDHSHLTVKGYNDASILVKDFIHNGETISDPVNRANFYLAGSVGYCLGNGTCPEGAKVKGFTASFNALGSIFNVSITEEPLKADRVAAEQFLISRLGITKNNMCRLNYKVTVTDDLNPIYTGSNLGFSFCPGAVQLP